jgi:uncharacterized protein
MEVMDPGTHSAAAPGRRKAGRVLFFLAGSLALVLAVVGAILPLLPTTPFLIIAAYCYARSSDRVHGWLLSNRLFGRQLRDYTTGAGVSWRVKTGALVLLWVTIGLSAVLFAPYVWLRVVLVLIGLVVSLHIVRVKARGRVAAVAPRSPVPAPNALAAEPQPDQRMPES